MPLANAQKFVSAMRSDEEFRAAVTSISGSLELRNYLQSRGFEFDLPDLIRAMAACMAASEPESQ